MINQIYVDKLISLIRQGLITIDDIKVQEYKDAAINAFRQEVVDGKITAEQYKQYTGQDYAA